MMILILILIVVISAIGDSAFAAWAKHAVVNPETVAEYEPYAPSVSIIPKSQVRIALPQSSHQGDTNKGYFLIICTNRLLTEDLDLRSALQIWKYYSLIRTNAENTNVWIREHYDRLRITELRHVDPIVEIRPIPAEEYAKPDEPIEILLDIDIAKRSYVAWDFMFIYEQGGCVMDGGLWLTYDIPAFVERLDNPYSAPPQGSPGMTAPIHPQ
jgi:hypothetical protein